MTRHIVITRHTTHGIRIIDLAARTPGHAAERAEHHDPGSTALAVLTPDEWGKAQRRTFAEIAVIVQAA